MDRIRIIADDRERQSGVIEKLRASPHFDVTVQRLPVGDYRVDSRFLFERKTLPDLAVAIIDGRLFGQASRLAATSMQPAMILEGTSRELAQSGMHWEAVQGALITVTLFYGIALLRTRTPAETVRTMLFAAQQGRALECGALPRHGYRPRGKRGRQLFILQGLPGIGPERAQRLLARFGSVEAVVTARAKELCTVSGIGARIAEKLRLAVDEPRSEYCAA